MKNKLIFIIAIGVFVLFVFFIFILNNQQFTKENALSPTITPVSSGSRQTNKPLKPDEDKSYNREFRENILKEKPFFEKQEKILDLINSLPYKGTGFSMDYNIQNGSFDVYLKNYSLNKSTQEFEQYLKSKGVDPNEITIITHYQ